MHPENHDNSYSPSFQEELLDRVPDLMFKLNWDSKDGNYTVVYCNNAVNDIYEVTPEELKRNPRIFFHDRLFPDDREITFEKIRHSRETITELDHEYRIVLPIKGMRWMRVIAMPEKMPDGSLCFFGRVTDITHEKEQEQELELSEERYTFALQAASEGIWDWDMVAKTIYFSAQSMKIIGMEEKEAVVPFEFWRSRIHPDDLKGYEKAKNDHLKGKTSSYESIYRVSRNDGSYRWILSRGRVVQFDARKKPIRGIGTHKDITQLKEKEIELGNTINIIGNQNSRLSNFAHIVSHNLRSHSGNLKMLLDLFKTANEAEREEMLQHLEAISDGLAVTITHLKELVEIQFEIKTVKEKLNLRHYLKNILNILHNEINRLGVIIEVNIPLDVTVEYNPAYLESVLLNLTTNAIKYSGSDRVLMLSYDFGIVNGKKVLSVSDNGLGIDLKKHKNSIFGMYKTFHKHQNSRGIGLFITKNQIEAMGGTIEVTSEVNKGTTFKIYFNEED
ncbi:MAG: PAS domain-containing sensor histidine kinase [Pedobacter sp.]|nr:MAG: PAS domain-containing sensor histidine kinase [Pedobacter sp.]